MPDGYFRSPKATGAFVGHFHTIALPNLKREICRIAILVEDGAMDFDEAYENASSLAHKLGADFLPERIASDLPDWILSELSDAVLEAKERADGIQENIERAIELNPVGFWERLAKTCSDPERSRWAFASRCPEYRKQLVAERGNR